MAVLGLSDAERAQVEAAVTAAEARTAARFAVVVAHASDDYAPYPIMWAAAVALIVGDIVALAWPGLSTLSIIGVQTVLFIVADPLLHLRPLRYRAVPQRVRKAHAHRLAAIEFAALVHDRAAGDVGLLLFISEAERHVEIKADRGIDQHVDQAAWDKIVADLGTGIGQGSVARALTDAIGACADILAKHFPATADASPPGGPKLQEL